MAIVPPFLKAIFAEANRIAPSRSRASDGSVGDAAHQARTSDHNPDARGIVHADDLTHNPPTFDAHAWGEVVRRRCESGAETRIKNLVSHNFATGKDLVASPTRTFLGLVGKRWQWRTTSSRDHANHLHISILSGETVEDSTDPLFIVDAPQTTVPAISTMESDDLLLESSIPKSNDPNRPAVGELRRADKCIVLYNNAALGGDTAVFNVRVRYLTEIKAPVAGWRSVPGGVQVLDVAGAAFRYEWT